MSNPTRKAGDLFDRALEIACPEERGRFVEETCADDPELFDQVARLLSAHEKAEGRFPTDPQHCLIAVPAAGERIHGYRLLEQIGEGGMGVVYMAEQEEPVRRKVALKIIKAGMDTRSVVARFEAERQALAMMNHPSIAKVLDAGATDSGRPYFVMELVRGVPVTRFCEENRLSIRERLRLFVRVCRAIQHAHQKGVIHRDIKPSNVLVTLSEGDAHPMIIDFGVAKAIDQQLTEKTLFTNFAQMIGTPAYMSPEQAAMSRDDIDTRTDVYSLGVLLYELLTGSTPFPEERLRTLAYDEMRRVIREEEPARPSALISGMNGRSRMVAQNRQLEPAALIRHISGDLDWIILKAIDKARSRRYDTPNELAADIERHISDEPVIARPPSRIYQIRKFTRRHRMTVMAGGAVAAALVIGLSLALLGMRSAERERVVAKAQFRSARLNAYAAQINLAQRHIAEGSRDRAQTLLSSYIPEDGEEDIRGWEWQYLWSQLRSDAVGSIGRHSDGVTSVAFSPDGQLIASADLVGNVVIRDLHSSETLYSWKDEACVYEVAFHSDSMAVSAGESGIIHFHDLDVGQSMAVADLGTPIQALAVSASGSNLAALTGYYANEAAFVWRLSRSMDSVAFPDLVERHEISGLDKSRGQYFQGAVAFSPDGRELAVGYSDGMVRLYQSNAGRTLNVLEGPHSIVRTLDYSPDGRFLSWGATGVEDVLVWDTSSGELAAKLRGHVRSARCVSFSGDGRFLFTVDGNQNIRRFGTGDWLLDGEYRGPRSRIFDLETSPVDESFVTGGLDGDIWIWNAAQSGKDFEPVNIPGLRDFDFSPDGERLATVEPVDGDPARWRVRFRSVDGKAVEEKLSALGGQVSDVAFSADGRLLAAMDSEGWSIWNCLDDRVESRGAIPGERTTILAGFNRNSSSLLCVDSEFQVTLLNCETGRIDEQWSASSGHRVPTYFDDWNVAFHPLTETLVLGGEGAAMIWDAGKRQLRGVIETSTALGVYPAISSDGRRLAIVEGKGRVTLWDAGTLEFVRELEGQIRFANSAAFSPDGRRLAVGMASHVSAVRILDIETGMDLIGLDEGSGHTRKIRWSPDGGTLLTLTREGFVYSPSTDQ